MDSDKKIPVACFAPSLDDAKLASYESLITAMDESETKDALLVLLRCVKAWWALPESSRKDGDPFSITHQGSLVQYKTTPLEPDQVKTLWDATPWMRELSSLSPEKGPDAGNGLLDLLQVDSVRRNEEKSRAWADATSNAMLKAALGESQLEFVSGPRFNAMRAMLRSCDTLAANGDSTAPAVRDGVFAIFGLTSIGYEELVAKIVACNESVLAVLKGQAEGPIPRPSLESTEIRDAAFHLLWHCKEITLDREPLTSDKLAGDKISVE